MSVTVEQLKSFAGKQVLMHVITEDGDLDEVFGKVEAASDVGIAFKPKGSSTVQLFLPDQIEEMTGAPAKKRTVSQRKLKPIGEDKILRHLLDFHGVPLSWAKETAPKDAVQYHNDLDHADLGHNHDKEDVVEVDVEDADDLNIEEDVQ